MVGYLLIAVYKRTVLPDTFTISLIIDLTTIRNLIDFSANGAFRNSQFRQVFFWKAFPFEGMNFIVIFMENSKCRYFTR